MVFPEVLDPVFGIAPLELPGIVARVQTAKVRATPPEVRSMWRKRRADGNVVDRDHYRFGLHGYGRHLEALLVELGA
jgi:hypothetical protein